MNKILKTLSALAASLLLSLSALNASAAVVTQLGFALDESGSMSAADYELMQDGLAAALAALPLDGTVEITVVSFSTNVTTLVNPTVLTGATLAGIQAAIDADLFSGNTTHTAEAIQDLAALMTGSANFAGATNSFINIATDGAPNGDNCASLSSQACAVLRAQQAAAAGIDTISFEGVSSTGSARDAMLEIALAGSNGKGGSILAPNPAVIPYPGTATFVAPVTTFENFAAVIEAKVISAVTPVPTPASPALLAIGLIALGALARRRTA